MPGHGLLAGSSPCSATVLPVQKDAAVGVRGNETSTSGYNLYFIRADVGNAVAIADPDSWFALFRRDMGNSDGAKIGNSEAGAGRRKTGFASHFESLKSMKSLRDDWNGMGSAAPSTFARLQAMEALEILLDKTFCPDKVVPSAEDGVAISFRKGDRYALVECYNNGEVAAATSVDGGRIDSWDVEPTELGDTLERIYDFIESRNS